MILKYIQLSKLKTPLGKMAGIALKGQCDLDSIMVPPKVSMKENFNGGHNSVNYEKSPEKDTHNSVKCQIVKMIPIIP